MAVEWPNNKQRPVILRLRNIEFNLRMFSTAQYHPHPMLKSNSKEIIRQLMSMYANAIALHHRVPRVILNQTLYILCTVKCLHLISSSFFSSTRTFRISSPKWSGIFLKYYSFTVRIWICLFFLLLRTADFLDQM